MKYILFFTFFIVLFSCKGQNNKFADQAITEKRIIVDSLKWMYQSEVFSDELTLTNDLHFSFEDIRPKRRMCNIDTKKSYSESIQKVLSSIPEQYLNSKESGIRIGAPHEYDQGAFLLTLFRSDNSIFSIQIDTNRERWPKSSIAFFTEIEKLYNEIKQSGKGYKSQ